MEKIAYESINIITPFKLITFSLRNNILLQPQPEDLNKMYFFDQVIYIYIYIGLEIHFITFCYYLDLHSIKVDTHTHTHTHIYIYIHTLAVELLYNMYYFLFDCYE